MDNQNTKGYGDTIAHQLVLILVLMDNQNTLFHSLWQLLWRLNPCSNG